MIEPRRPPHLVVDEGTSVTALVIDFLEAGLRPLPVIRCLGVMVYGNIGDVDLMTRVNQLRGPGTVAGPGPSGAAGIPFVRLQHKRPLRGRRHHQQADPVGTGRRLPGSPAERHPPGRQGVRGAGDGAGDLLHLHGEVQELPMGSAGSTRTRWRSAPCVRRRPGRTPGTG